MRGDKTHTSKLGAELAEWDNGGAEGTELRSARIWEILGGRPWESGIEGSGVAGVGDDT